MTPAWIASASGTLAYTLVLAFWETGLMALLAAWLATRSDMRAPARRHTLVSASLVVAALLVAATWWTLTYAPARTETGAGSAPVPLPASTHIYSQAFEVLTAGASWAENVRPSWTRLADWRSSMTLIWLTVSGLLIVRLCGGVLLTLRIRSRAAPLTGPVTDAARRLAGRVGLRRHFDVAASADIECPAATGWTRPGLLVPADLSLCLADQQLTPVLAHELEHLRRGHQWIALAQGLADALLFFCPGVLWLSSEARKAREEVCDDVAVQVCGNAHDYATALGILASRSSGAWLTSALMGVQAPSVATRIRRILKGDSMHARTRLQSVALLLAVVVTVLAGSILFASSFAALRGGRMTVGQAGTPQIPKVPFGISARVGASPVTITSAHGNDDYCFTEIGLRNASEQHVTSVAFLAVFEAMDRTHPVLLVRSPSIPVSLAPGAATTISLAFLPISDVFEWRASRGIRAQPFLAAIEAEFGDGDKWALTPRTDATTTDAVFYREPPVLSRSLLGSGRPGRACRDDLGATYSHGALIGIRGEKGAFAECSTGVWVERSVSRFASAPADGGPSVDGAARRSRRRVPAANAWSSAERRGQRR